MISILKNARFTRSGAKSWPWAFFGLQNSLFSAFQSFWKAFWDLLGAFRKLPGDSVNLSKLLENFLKASQRLSKLPEASQRRPDPEPTKDRTPKPPNPEEAGPRTHKKQDPEPIKGKTPNPQEPGPRTHKGPDPEPTKGRTPNPQEAGPRTHKRQTKIQNFKAPKRRWFQY